MQNGQRIFIAALLLSVLVHLVLAGSSRHWWTPLASEIPFPIEAHLQLPETARVVAQVSAPAPVTGVRQTTTVPQPRQSPQAPAAEMPTAVSVPPDAAEPVVVAQAAPVELPTPEVTPPAMPQNLSQNLSPTAADAPPARPLRSLPQQLALRYSVQSGEDGFTLGESLYSGWIRDGRYSLSSVSEATGVAAMFVSGKIIQRSEGSIGPDGLQPERFWGEKGSRVQTPVRFDWPSRLLALPGGSVELPTQTQDLLSFPFHLAMTLQVTDAPWTLPVTNGKKLRIYQFQIVGRESLNLGDQRVEALRVQGSRAGEGSLDVWLAESRHWLPVKIRTLDQKGKVIVLTLLEGGV